MLDSTPLFLEFYYMKAEYMYIPMLKNSRLRHILKMFCLNDKGKLLLLNLVLSFLFKVKRLIISDL